MCIQVKRLKTSIAPKHQYESYIPIRTAYSVNGKYTGPLLWYSGHISKIYWVPCMQDMSPYQKIGFAHPCPTRQTCQLVSYPGLLPPLLYLLFEQLHTCALFKEYDEMKSHAHSCITSDTSMSYITFTSIYKYNSICVKIHN